MLPISACTTANDGMDSFHFTNEDSPICHKYIIFTMFFSQWAYQCLCVLSTVTIATINMRI